MANSGYSLKDELFNENTIGMLCQALKRVYPTLNDVGFMKDVLAGIEPLELKERIGCIREHIKAYVPLSYEETLPLLLKSLTVESTGQFAYGAYSDYVAAYGCDDTNLALSLEYLGEFTKWFSAEFSIRRFINTYPEATLKKLHEWSLSEDEHQRRLASEGLRPKLPWAEKINVTIEEGASPLENLYYDKVRTVTRSVANHLNDISKMEPDYVIARLKSWKASGKQNPDEMAYIISHSLRTLVKKGNPEALSLLGYKQNPQINVGPIHVVKERIHIGDKLEFEFELSASEDANLMIDYVVDYPKANNKRATKVFKLKKLAVKKGGSYKLKKAHLFAEMTTKKLYTGEYQLMLQINGKSFQSVKFFLMVS